VSRKNVPFRLNTFYTNYKKLAPSKTKLATTPVSTLKDLTTGDAALEKRFTPVLVAETATTEPIVGVGTGPFTPFWAMAAADRLAKPTDGGLNLKTEYTFFRNVSPMIQAGALPLVCISKKAPTHWVFDTCVSMKSEGLTDHEGPPKEIETVTCVLQGYV